MLDDCTNTVKEVFLNLSCDKRFQVIYEIMKAPKCNLKEFIKEIEAIAIGRTITTVADEECELLVN